uniref:Metalloendopeptidase n=2 Tax=Esox lucius TaxID=8010 RepID=A0AAY5KMH6_ESOLU
MDLMEQIPSVSLLLLLVGLSQASPVMKQVDGPEISMTKTILIINNGSRQFLLEGDIVTPTTRNAMICYSSGCFWRKGSNGKVEVPYIVSSEFSSNERHTIETAVKNINSKTCIRFVPRQNQADYLSYEPRDGCWSSLGRQGNQQVVSLQSGGCVTFGIVQHETLHALGFQHEQTRSDRDDYVVINWSNIDPDNSFNFDKTQTNNLNTPYDYGSVMHYDNTAFSINGQDTITPIPYPNVPIGQRVGLSSTDILKINRLYNC